MVTQTQSDITPRDILRQIGWFDESKCFISFTLTPEQMDLLLAASARLGKCDGELIEELCRRSV